MSEEFKNIRRLALQDYVETHLDQLNTFFKVNYTLEEVLADDELMQQIYCLKAMEGKENV